MPNAAWLKNRASFWIRAPRSTFRPPRSVRRFRASYAVAFALLLFGIEAGSGPAGKPWQVRGTPAVLTQAVAFSNDGGVLRGTLYRPDTSQRVPAVVAFHGAGLDARTRRCTSICAKVCRQWGSPSSCTIGAARGGRPARKTSAIETLADDGIAGARAIARIPAIDPNRIGYWGLSQGGWLAVFAAERDPHAAVAVTVSAPLVTPELQMNSR